MQRGVSTPVGSGQGQVFIYDRSNLVLDDPKAPLLLNKYLEQAKSAKIAGDKKKAESGEKLKKFMDDSPEYWYRHDKEIQSGMDELYNMGAEILSNNADPFTGTDPASIEFRRRRDKVEKLSKYSTQLKELHGEYFKKIDSGGKDGEKYTKASKEAVAQYFETPLNSLIDENKEPPRLEMANPAFSILKYDTEMAKNISAAKGEGVSDTDIAAFAAKSLEDPDVNDAVHTQLSQLSEQGRNRLTAMAQNQGMTPEAYYRFQQMKPHFEDPTAAFDFTKVENQMKPGLSSSSIEEGDVTKSVTRLNPSRAQEMAELIVQANPKYVQAGVGSGRFGSAANTFDENTKAAIEWNKKRLLAQAKNDYKRSEDEGGDQSFGGYGRQEYMANRSEWLDAIRTGDEDTAREAGDYLKGIKLEDGSTIEKVINPTTGPGVLMNQADAAIRLQTVRTYKEDGVIKEERNFVDLERGYDTDEYLLRLHDQAFSGPAKKNMFGKTERSVKTKGAYVPGKPIAEDTTPAYLKIIK